jgi:predicted  nucleic acid-binding Zn-ribbon protein
MAENTITTWESEIELFADEAKEIQERKQELEEQLQTLQTDLDEKLVELREVLATTGEEEQTLEARREEALTFVGKADIELYTRIRNAKGKAVAPIRRGSCSGCYNVVPPQRILEIKKHEQLFICEHCGRILVSEEIAQETKLK